MKVYKNGCVDCGLPCLGAGCAHFEEEHYYCDACGCEVDCADCAWELFGDDEDECDDDEVSA